MSYLLLDAVRQHPPRLLMEYEYKGDIGAARYRYACLVVLAEEVTAFTLLVETNVTATGEWDKLKKHQKEYLYPTLQKFLKKIDIRSYQGGDEVLQLVEKADKLVMEANAKGDLSLAQKSLTAAVRTMQELTDALKEVADIDIHILKRAIEWDMGGKNWRRPPAIDTEKIKRDQDDIVAKKRKEIGKFSK